MSVAKVECNQCGRTFEVNTEYFQKYGSDPFCPDCLIHTDCENCGRGLRLRPSRYQELGGDPIICSQCDQRSKPQGTRREKKKTSFWYGLTPGEKIIFPVVVLVGIGALLSMFVYPDVTGEQVGSAIGACFLLTFWMISRGEKNNPNT
ncbi:hypothetical protein C478_10928 [Natrinema thermotolerans DSM 11552]|nr:hypothetical protein C478_10928 [Natrinema thermotolerans DSM 11552]